MGQLLDKVFSLPEPQVLERIADTKSVNRLVSIGFILYGVILPFLLVIIGLLMNYFEVPIGYLTELLPNSRIVVIALSILSICYPWLMRDRWLTKFQSKTASPQVGIYWAGLVFSIVPVVYGFLLFVAMGASILELCLYAVVSSVAAILWYMNNEVFREQKAG